MRTPYWSEQYGIDCEAYVSEREERMIAQIGDFFWKCFFYLRQNRVEGDYLEFGCGNNMRSFRLAAKFRRLEKLDSMRLFAFDSFEGLPELKGVDEVAPWSKGQMALSLEAFHEALRIQGIEAAEYKAVKGFYDRTLTNHGFADYGIEQAAMAFVDCDLYGSTKEVLAFLGDGLAEGGILAFDDWFCFHGDPRKGEQLAFDQFKHSHPDLFFTDFQSFGWHGRSFLVHRK